MIIYIAPALVIAAILVTVFARRRYMPTEEEVARLIQNRLQFGMSGEWDYFQLVDIRDKQLNSIQERCLELDYFSAEDREQGLKKMLANLRARN